VELYLLPPILHRFPSLNNPRLTPELFIKIAEFHAILILKFLVGSGYVPKQLQQHWPQ
jgi:hypothetical protein